MDRRVRLAVALVIAVSSTGCSGDDAAVRPTLADTTLVVSTEPGSDPTPATAAPSTSAPPAITTGPATPVPTTPVPTTPVPTTSSPSSAATTVPLVVEAKGWRVTITAPVAGAPLGRVPLVCYEASGTTREPVLALDYRLGALGAPPGSGAGDPWRRVDIAIGRGSAAMDFTGDPPGSYDLEVALVVEGLQVPDAVLTIENVMLTTTAPAVPCP